MAQAVQDIINASERSDIGKGPNRRARANGQVPAIIYGRGTESQKLSIPEKEFLATVERYGLGHVYGLTVDGEARGKVLIKEYQRDAVKHKLTHVDFLAVFEDQMVVLPLPVVLEGRPKGVVIGGTLTQLRRTMTVKCLPKDLPAQIVVDVSDIEAGTSMRLSEVKLPSGVILATEDTVLCSVSAPRAKETAGGEEEKKAKKK